jgi:hypothetical protein
MNTMYTNIYKLYSSMVFHFGHVPKFPLKVVSSKTFCLQVSAHFDHHYPSPDIVGHQSFAHPHLCVARNLRYHILSEWTCFVASYRGIPWRFKLRRLSSLIQVARIPCRGCEPGKWQLPATFVKSWGKQYTTTIVGSSTLL